MAPRIYVGRFDPRFVGVTIRAVSDSDVHSFRYHQRSPLAPAVLGELSDDMVVSDLSRRTVLDHEVRHFRDSLLFPFGAAATRSRISATYNGFMATMLVKRLHGDANVLPVPLQRWLHMSLAERDAFLAGEIAFARADLRPPPLPVISGDDDVTDFLAGVASLDVDEEGLVAFCRLALADYRMIEDIWRSPHAEGDEMVFPAIDCWEAAGLICQLAAIEQYAGGSLMQRFVDWVDRCGPRTYRRGLALLNWLLERLRWKPTMRNYLVVTAWAQMGAYETEKSDSSPGYRIARLVSATSHGATWSEDSAFRDLIEDWDAIAGVDSLAALRAATARFRDFCRRLEGTTRLLPAELLTSLADAREQMMTAFLADPDAYVDPAVYLAEEAGYPQPCVGLQYPSASFGSGWTDCTPSGWSPAVSFDATLSLANLALLSDAVFLPGEKSLLPNGRLAIESLMDLKAIRVIR